MSIEANDILGAVAIGIGATLVMDLWNLFLKRTFSIPSLNYCLLGRWLRHMPGGTFTHASITAAPPKPFECTVGWIAHYTIGVTFTLVFVALTSGAWLARPTLLPALLYGIGTVVFPFFIMQPSLGLGIAASRTPKPTQARLKSLVTHTVFGVGLYVCALGGAMLIRFSTCGFGGLVAACGAAAAPAVQDGDIIFQTSRSSQSLAIQRATHSPYSHMGIILHRGGRPFVFEAVSTVRYTPLAEWTARGRGGHYVVKRLRDAPRGLAPAKVAKLRRTAESFQRRPYDLTFEWSDSRLYCSELVWKIYDRALGVQIGGLQRLRHFDLSDPEVRGRMQQRYGPRVPLDETVISPAAMFAASNLVTVASR